MTRVEGCEIDRIDGAVSKAWLDHVLGRAAAPIALGDPAWLLCHCDDGVTWGRFEGGVWRLGSTVFQDLCPHPSALVLLELRVFSAVAEVLIWRADDGLRGRILRDSAAPMKDVSCLPHDEERLLVSGRAGEHQNGFTRVGDGTGAEQALPFRVTEGSAHSWPRLRVRHYFARDNESGSVRVVATRLVEVK
ncbi:MAG: CRISPR-associated protein Csx19 [Thermoleophilia bacterium]|nr:CRISPR-associated protein Csx19 [Thermoleophilia bacterium]